MNELNGLKMLKSLKLSTESRKSASSGEIANLMQVNTQTFIEFAQFFNNLWSSPLQLIIVIVILWFYLKAAVFAGLATLAILVPINAYLMSKYSFAESDKLKLKDLRVKMMIELLNGIKVLNFI